MSRGLAALMRINEKVDVPYNYNFEKDYDLIEKELEALEIIKKYLNLSCGQEYIKINIPTGDICICINHDEYKVLEGVLL